MKKVSSGYRPDASTWEEIEKAIEAAGPPEISKAQFIDMAVREKLERAQAGPAERSLNPPHASTPAYLPHHRELHDQVERILTSGNAKLIAELMDRIAFLAKVAHNEPSSRPIPRKVVR